MQVEWPRVKVCKLFIGGNIITIVITDGEEFHCYFKSLNWHFLVSWQVMALKNSFLSSDDQQIHKYQQNKLGTSTQNTKRRPQFMTVEIQALYWDRHKNVAGLNQLKGSYFYGYIKYSWNSHVVLENIYVTVKKPY